MSAEHPATLWDVYRDADGNPVTMRVFVLEPCPAVGPSRILGGARIEWLRERDRDEARWGMGDGDESF